MINSYAKFLESADHNGVFWGSVAAGVLPICTKTKRILIAYRSKYVNEPSTFGVIGGKLDDDEVQTDIQGVVKREFEEETGISSKGVKLIPSYIFVSPRGDFRYYNFIGLFDYEFEAIPDWETEYFKWVTLDELLKIKPKHFGLDALIKNDINTIKKYVEQ